MAILVGRIGVAVPAEVLGRADGGFEAGGLAGFLQSGGAQFGSHARYVVYNSLAEKGCGTYNERMETCSNKPPPPPPQSRDSLSVEIGRWFKADATGGGVVVIGVILVILALVGLAQVWLTLG